MHCLVKKNNSTALRSTLTNEICEHVKWINLDLPRETGGRMDKGECCWHYKQVFMAAGSAGMGVTLSHTHTRTCVWVKHICCTYILPKWLFMHISLKNQGSSHPGKWYIDRSDGQRENGLMGLFKHPGRSWQRGTFVAIACLWTYPSPHPLRSLLYPYLPFHPCALWESPQGPTAPPTGAKIDTWAIRTRLVNCNRNYGLPKFKAKGLWS